MKRLTLLVGLSDLDEAFVVGCWEEGILDILDADEVEKEFAKMKGKWAPDYTEWREITILVDETKLLEAFVAPEITADVE